MLFRVKVTVAYSAISLTEHQITWTEPDLVLIAPTWILRQQSLFLIRLLAFGTCPFTPTAQGTWDSYTVWNKSNKFISWNHRWNETECQRNISVKIQISLSPCKEGACGPHGRCIQYFSAGLIYSACVCSSGKIVFPSKKFKKEIKAKKTEKATIQRKFCNLEGFGGWSCSDGTNALSTTILLTSVLLLTLSNLFFIPAIALGFRRGFYSQCMLYFVTMFFSSVTNWLPSFC